ncbi:MAG: apolipoprotein N-acyltransferase [Bauldia sp.]
MQAVADAIVVAWGWRRAAIAMAAGAASALAMAPFDLVPILFVTMPVIVWLLDGAVAPEGSGLLARAWPAVSVGWCAGFGYFLAGLWWLGAAFLVDAEKFAWLMPAAVVSLPAALALTWAFGAAVARMFWSDGWPRVLSFAGAMAGAEWLRGHILTGFPWNALGYALMPAPPLMQIASLVGLWGATLFAFFLFATPVLFIGPEGSRRGRLAVIGVAALLLALDFVFGILRLHDAGREVVANVRLRLVQPALDQRLKMQVGRDDEILKRYLDLSASVRGPDRRGVASATHLIWPESAFPFLLAERPAALSAIGALLPAGTTLITGAARADRTAKAVYNALYVINDRGEITQTYDKLHLVPFGEYLPFQAWLESLGLRQLTQLPGGFTAGKEAKAIALRDAPSFAPLICYEAIFPGAVVPSGERPGWLLNVTNDAWYGNTPGPRQHLRQAVVRAVEEGLPLVRNGNNGISAIVDAYGRVTAELGLGETGVLDGPLPVRLDVTFYARFGDAVFLVLLITCWAFALVGRRRTGD